MRRWVLIWIVLGGCHWALPLPRREPAADMVGSGSDGARAVDALSRAEGLLPPDGGLPGSDVAPGPCAADALGCVTTLAGVCGKTPLPFKNGPALAATFYKPRGLAWDKVNARLYIADSQNHCIRVLANGKVSTLAGACGSPGEADDPDPLKASFNQPRGLALDLGGLTLLVADTMNNRIRRVALPAGPVTTVAGSGKAGNLDRTALSAEFNQPRGVAVDGAYTYVADTLNDAIRLIHAGVVSTLTGPPTLDGPTDIVTDLQQHLVTDTLHHRVLRVQGSMASVVAGGIKGLNDGAADQAQFNEPAGIALVELPPGGEPILFVADEKNHRIRAMALGKDTVATAAGTDAGFADGFWDKAAFRSPSDVVAGPQGVLYVADTDNHCVRRYNLPP